MQTWAFEAGRLFALWADVASTTGRVNYLGTAKRERDLMTEPQRALAAMLQDLTARWWNRLSPEFHEKLSVWSTNWVDQEYTIPARCSYRDIIEIAQGLSSARLQQRIAEAAV